MSSQYIQHAMRAIAISHRSEGSGGRKIEQVDQQAYS